MSTFVIGDIHGCFKTLRALLEAIQFEPGIDRIVLVGDLVGKGPAPLEVLRWACTNSASVDTVLGNHDLHLIRRYYRIRDAKETDNLDEVLSAPDAALLIDWLARRPLLISLDGFRVVHAGILPAWSSRRVERFARKAGKALVREPVPTLRRAAEPISGSSDDDPELALRVLTSVRCCDRKGAPDFDYSGPPRTAPAGLIPWYAHPRFDHEGLTFIFGHWAQHGIGGSRHAICLDTSCVYGGMLSALRLPDRYLIQVPNQEGLAGPR